MATADANDGGGFAGSQEPTWFFWAMDNGTTASSLLTWQATGCIHTTNTYNVWWTGNPSSGPNIPYSWLSVTNTDASTLLTEAEGFENDCGGSCTYESSGPFLSSCWVNSDDNFDSRASAGSINFLLDPPCTWNQYTIHRGDYYAKLEIYWDYISIDAGTIDGNQSVCIGGDPSILNSLSLGTPGISSFATYQWQESIGCTGTYTNITGATSASYDPPAGITQNTCYQRLVITNCGNIASNSITVSLETPSTDPSSVLANPITICGSGTVDLSVIGGGLGTGASWQWYNGDPNAGGISIGNGNPLNNINISSTTNFFVRAEGNCDSSNTANQLVIVELASIAPTSITSTFNPICLGDIIDLTANGGTLGTNAIYAWYNVNPTTNSTSPIYTSSTVNYQGITPTSTTTYYVRAEGCDTSITASITINVETLSQDPTSISSTFATVCAGDPVNLNIQGGSLGTGASWVWYSGACGAGASIGSGNQITVNPTLQTTYYARAEGSCNTTNCANVTININDSSSSANTIIPSVSNICPGGLSLLSISGGTLGTGAVWQWYENSCGGISVGSGSSINVSPATTTTYFLRAEGVCNTTNCISTTITVNQLSIEPTSINTSANNICPGTSINLDAIGGTLGTGATYEWYSGSCGGLYIGSGASISVSPTSTTNYYVRAEGTCNNTICASITISVEQTSIIPTNISATNINICPGGSTTIDVSGGFLAPNDDYYWYSGSCGTGVFIGNGSQITVSPNINTTYYVRIEGPCGNTSCLDITITLNTISNSANSITASSTSICPGQNSVLTISGGALGTGASWQWYSGSCGGNPVGSGISVSVSPLTTSTYYVRAEGTCGNTSCVPVTINVGVGVSAPSSANVITNNICPSDTTSIYVIGAVLPIGYTYVWYTGACGAVPIGVGDTLEVSPNVTETYYVRAVGTCGATSCQQIDVIVLNGNVAPSGVSSNNNNFCIGDSATLSVTGGSLVSGASWQWYENSCGGVSIGSGSSITVSPSTSTVYYVRAEGGACGNTACESIFISIQQVIVHMNPFDTLCGTGFAFTLNNGEPLGGTYSGNGVINGIFYPSIVGDGTHNITYTYSNSNGCSDTSSRNLIIIPSNLAGTLDIIQQPCAEGGVTLYANISGGNGFLSFLWNDGAIENPREYVQEGTYSIMIRDSKNCILELGDIEVTEEMDCFEIPNTITPNSDGKNETWNLDFSSYNNLNLEIYSRWGRLVWSSSELIIHWGGIDMTGKALPSGTYYYILNLDNGNKSQTGPIIILK